jgi:hypothetical protein
MDRRPQPLTTQRLHSKSEKKPIADSLSLADLLQANLTSELPSSPRFNLKRPGEQNAFLWSLDRGFIENTKISFHSTVILQDKKTWLVEFL